MPKLTILEILLKNLNFHHLSPNQQEIHLKLILNKFKIMKIEVKLQIDHQKKNQNEKGRNLMIVMVQTYKIPLELSVLIHKIILQQEVHLAEYH